MEEHFQSYLHLTVSCTTDLDYCPSLTEGVCVAERPLALIKALCISRHVLAVVINDLCATDSS